MKKQKLIHVGRIWMAIMLLGWLLPVTVKADGPYKLVQVTEVKAGGLYVFEQKGYVMNNTIPSNALQTTNSYKAKGLSGTETYVWTLEKKGTGFYMKNVSLVSNAYLNNSSSTDLSFGSSSSIWKFTFNTDGTAIIQNTSNSNRFLGYYTASSHVYRAYAVSNLETYPHAIKVYQLVEYESFTASFSINGSLGSPTQCVEYSNVNFPSRPADIEGKKFIGWSTSAIDGKTNEQPDLLLETTMPSKDITYYAVFGNVVENNVTATFDPADISNLENHETYPNDWIHKATGIELWLNGGEHVTDAPAHFKINATNGKYLGVELIQGYLVDVNVTLTDAANTIVRVNPGTLTTEGTSQTVTFEGIVNTARCYTDGSHPITISKVVVNAKSWAVTNYCTTITENHPVTITSSAKYATYSATQPSDFSGTGVTVFTARVSDDRVLLDEVTNGIVPANVGVVLYKDIAENEMVTVPATTCAATAIDGNELLVSDGSVAGNGSTLFALAKKSQGVGFYLVKSGVAIPAGRPYLVISNSGTREFLGFDEEPDVITCAEEDNGQDFRYFNLSGQSFTTPPAPGLYVLRPAKGRMQGANGKKVLIK